MVKNTFIEKNTQVVDEFKTRQSIVILSEELLLAICSITYGTSGLIK